MDGVDFYIIVPVYNVERSIRDCIQSVLDQTYMRWQMLLVDDGSKDQSGVVCDEYSKMYDNITVIHQENKGLFETRQVGIRFMLEQCRGKENLVYMISLDSDDTLKNYALDRINHSIMKFGCDMVVYGFEWIKNGKVDSQYGGKNHFSGMVQDKRKLYQMTCMAREYSSVCLKAISLSVMLDERKYADVKVTWGEDVIQSLDYWRNSSKVYFLDEPLYNYMSNSQSITARGWEFYYRDELTINEVIYSFLEQERILSSEDWAAYKKWCIGYMASIVAQICYEKTTAIKIMSILKEIRHSGYYIDKIEGCSVRAVEGKGRWIAYCFEKKQYGLIYVTARLYNIYRRICGVVKHVS